MRIAFVTETWRPHVDGVVTRLNATIARLVAGGHEILVIAPTRDVDIPGVRQEVIRHALIPIIDRSRPWALPDRRVTDLVEAFRPDLVHLISPVLMGSVAARRLAGRYPMVSSFHTDVAAYTSRYGLGPLRPVLNWMTRRTYARSDLRLATSTTGRRRLAEVGIDPASVILWPPGIGADYAASGSMATAPVENGVRADLSVLYVGRLAREKDCELLLPVARQVGSDGPELRFTFAGAGPDRRRLERLFTGAPAEFIGVLRGQEVITAYQQADVVVFTSTTDTVGLVLLEAAALGRPIVAVESPASLDTLGDYPRAVIIAADSSPADWRRAFARAVASPTLTGVQAARWRPPISWDEATDRLLDSYRTVRRLNHDRFVGR